VASPSYRVDSAPIPDPAYVAPDIGATERNKAIVRQFVDEVINRGNIGSLKTFVAADHVSHEPIGDHYGPEGIRIGLAGYRAAFPDLTVTIDDLVAEGDRVVRRFTAQGTHAGHFMGIVPTGRIVTVTGIWIDRLEGGKLVESWFSFDALGLLMQIGVVPDTVRPESHP